MQKKFKEMIKGQPSKVGFFLCKNREILYLKGENMFGFFKSKKEKRVEYIKSYQFPAILITKWKKKYPCIGFETQLNVQKALKDYFIMYASNMDKSEVIKHGLSMPSKVVDDLWHEFILMTKDYHDFCEKAFGKYLHHNPSHKETNYDLRESKLDKGLLNSYTFAVGATGSLPLLFMIDSTINGSGGYLYNTQSIEAQIEQSHARSASSYAGSSCGSVANGFTNSADSSGSSSDSGSSCGGGCGGD